MSVDDLPNPHETIIVNTFVGLHGGFARAVHGLAIREARAEACFEAWQTLSVLEM